MMDGDSAAKVERVRDLGRQFKALLHELGGTPPAGERFADRHLALANTHMEDAVFRAVASITKEV